MDLKEVERVLGTPSNGNNKFSVELIKELEELFLRGYSFTDLHKWTTYRKVKATFSSVRNLILQEAKKPGKTALREAVESRKRRSSPRKKTAQIEI